MTLEDRIKEYLERLFPITRSITGDGNRETLNILKEIIPLDVIDYQSGERVYDWTIPDEWKINDAWIKDSQGNKIISISENNLHIVSYSIPIDQYFDYDELIDKLHYIQDTPNAIPYRTSYYKDDWGFCLSYNQFVNLFRPGEEYHVHIDSTKGPGSLTIGEYKIRGRSEEEILVSSYICHPSMANDSLSGVIVSSFLAEYLSRISEELEFSYRFIFVPETIGAIAYLSHNERILKEINQGLVITTCGGPGKYGYKQSFDSKHEINSLAETVFKNNGIDFITYPFDIRGSDERQYSSQGFGINCITITKDKYYEYSEYHTSLDNLSFVRPKYIYKTINIYIELLELMDMNLKLVNTNKFCEPMLGKYDLYETKGGEYLPGNSKNKVDIVLWLLHYCNGKNTLRQVSEILDVEMRSIYIVAKELIKKDLLDYG